MDELYRSGDKSAAYLKLTEFTLKPQSTAVSFIRQMNKASDTKPKMLMQST